MYSLIKKAHKHGTEPVFAAVILSSSKYMKLDGLTLEGSHVLLYSRAPLCSSDAGVVRNLPLSHKWLSNVLLIIFYCAETSLL